MGLQESLQYCEVSNQSSENLSGKRNVKMAEFREGGLCRREDVVRSLWICSVEGSRIPTYRRVFSMGDGKWCAEEGTDRIRSSYDEAQSGTCCRGTCIEATIGHRRV